MQDDDEPGTDSPLPTFVRELGNYNELRYGSTRDDSYQTAS